MTKLGSRFINTTARDDAWVTLRQAPPTKRRGRMPLFDYSLEFRNDLLSCVTPEWSLADLELALQEALVLVRDHAQDYEALR